MRAENAALRAQVADLEAALAERSGPAQCGGSAVGEQGTSPLTLLRKLARQGTGQAELALGFGGGPLIIPDALLGAVVPDEYIILLDGDPLATPEQAAALIGVAPAQITHVYGRALSGFSARLSEAERDAALQAAGVSGIVQNGYIFASGPTAPQRLPKMRAPAILAQQPAAAPINVYLFDTGIRAAHRDLQGRVAKTGFSFFDNGIAGEDCSGHGTHVAARIAGRTLGVSATAQLVSVKVIDRFGTGDVATVIAGIDWVLGQPGEDKLVNMSLTRLVTQSPSVLDMAVQKLIDAGAIVVVAAGNAAADSSAYTPARVADAITVGSALRDGLSDFSNAGEGVDVYAPGEAISSASIRDVCGLQEMSGTSMAAPFVTGLIAQMLSAGAAPADVPALLRAQALRIDTGAFVGEVTRFVLPDRSRPFASLCGEVR